MPPHATFALTWNEEGTQKESVTSSPTGLWTSRADGRDLMIAHSFAHLNATLEGSWDV